MTRQPGSVRVMTWNIHGALGRNPGGDLDRVFPWLPEGLLGNHADRAARSLSDHLPGIVDIRLPPLPEPQERGGTS